jgi:CBS-domain-containing membrane protein
MKVADLMSTDVVSVHNYATVAEAVALLADEHVQALPVLDGSGRLVGELSTSEILEAEAEATERDSRETLFQETRVEELMMPRPVTLGPETDARDAARQMLYADVHRFFVELDGRLLGVVSQSDLVRALALGRV